MRRALAAVVDAMRSAAAGAALLLVAHPAAGADLVGHGGPVTGLAISADRSRALTASFDYSVVLWDLASGREIARLIGHDAAATAVAFLPDGRHAVSAGDDGLVGLWDLERAALVHRFTGHRGKVSSVTVTPDGTLAASGGWDGTVRLWDPARRQAVRTIAGNGESINAVAFAPDGAHLAVGARDGSLTLHRVADGAAVQSFVGHDFGVTAIGWTADGTRLASAAIDGGVRLWDRRSGRQLALLRDSEHPLLSLAISPDGRLAAAGSVDGRVLIWRLDDHSLVRAVDAIAGPIWAVAFAGAGAVLSGGADGVVRRWQIDGESHESIAAAAPAPDDGSRGAALFRKCSACHTLTADGGNRAGPTLYRLFGRPAGTVPGYPYSDALRRSRFVWSEATVDELFRRGPEEFVPGSKMPLQRMPNAEDRADLIEFLRQATEP